MPSFRATAATSLASLSITQAARSLTISRTSKTASRTVTVAARRTGPLVAGHVGSHVRSEVADDLDRSLIRHQVEMGVAVRMACLEVLARDLDNGPALK